MATDDLDADLNGGDGAPPEGVSKEEFEAVKASVAEIATGQGAISESIKQLAASITPAPAPAAAPAAASQSDDDLRDMSPTEVVAAITEAVLGNIGSRYDEQIETLSGNMMMLHTARQVDMCNARYENFEELQEETKQTLKDNPTLSVEKSFLLAAQEKGVTPMRRDGKAAPKPGEEPPAAPVKPGKKGALVFGDKPGAGPGTTVLGDASTTEEAAKRAAEEVYK